MGGRDEGYCAFSWGRGGGAPTSDDMGASQPCGSPAADGPCASFKARSRASAGDAKMRAMGRVGERYLVAAVPREDRVPFLEGFFETHFRDDPEADFAPEDSLLYQFGTWAANALEADPVHWPKLTLNSKASLTASSPRSEG